MPNRFIVVLTGLFVLPAAALPAMAAGMPTEMEVKTIIEKRDLGADKNFKFHSVLIAQVRKASPGEIAAVGMPANAMVVPVRVDYTEDTGGGWLRDHVQNYYFFKDDFGAWTAQSNAMPGNSTSEPHK